MSAVDRGGTLSLWDRAPFVASLWELMDKIAPILFSGTFASLTRAELELRHKWRVSAKDRDNIRTFTLMPAKVLCDTTGLSESTKACDRAEHDFVAMPKRGKLPFELAERLLTLREAIQSELNHRLVLIVKNGRESYWDNPSMFGDTVRNSFPSAAFDIAEAGKCWVAGRNNAVAYHLMMATEIGLRCLAEDRRVEIAKWGKSVPVEFAEWGTIISGIAAQIKEINKWNDRYKKVEAQKFYNALVLDLNAFHEGHRNHLAHGRGVAYTDHNTLALIEQVKGFLTRLCEKIGEGKITPEVW
jgi:hypothetical protein